MRISTVYFKILTAFWGLILSLAIVLFALAWPLVIEPLGEEWDKVYFDIVTLVEGSLQTAYPNGIIGTDPIGAQMQLEKFDEMFDSLLWLETNKGEVLVSSRPMPIPHFETDDDELDMDYLIAREVINDPEFNYHITIPIDFEDVTLSLNVLGHDEDPGSFLGLLGAILAAAAILSTLFAIPVSRFITRPLKQLEGSALKLASGDLQHRAGIGGTDETTRLGKAFNTMADRLNHSMQSNKDLLANISHEMRTPLARIRIAEELAEIRQGTGDTEGVKRHLDEIGAEVEEMDRLIGRLLEISRSEFRTSDEELEQVDIIPMLREKLRGIMPILTTKAVTLSQAIPDELHIYAYPDALQSALAHLADNGSKYVPHNGQMWVEATESTESMKLVVGNTHPKLSAKDMKRMFEPFIRLAPENARGSGLGLPLTQKIATSHGGTLEVKNVFNGVEFHLTLPKR